MNRKARTHVLSQLQNQDEGGKKSLSQTEEMGLSQVRQGEISENRENKG
jgi:hypothetical protein